MKKLGKREREARKRHRRGLYWSNSMPSGSKPLKLGHKHARRFFRCLWQIPESLGEAGRNELASRPPPHIYNLKVKEDWEMEKGLKQYMGYDNMGGASEGAVLIFAHNAREAKRIGWDAPTFLRDICSGEYINLRVSWMKDSPHIYKEAKQDKLKEGIPHVIECPTTCTGCELWGYDLNEDGYCETCEEDR